MLLDIAWNARFERTRRAVLLAKLDHTDPDRHGVAPADEHDKRRRLAEVAAAIAAIKLTRWNVLAGIIGPNLEAAAAQAARETLEATDGVLSTGDEEEIAQWARTWARDRAAELVGRRAVGGRLIPVTDAQHSLPASTLDMIAGHVREAIASGADASELATLLEKAPAFSAARAKRIATYETRNALHAAMLFAFKRSRRVKGSYWETMGDELVEEICLENEDASPMPLGQPFPSGNFAPLAHPGCRCILRPWYGETG